MAANYYTLKYASTGDVGGKSSIKILPTDIDMSTSLTLPGQGRVNYGEFFDTNILQMLEHFAKISPPFFPTTGQLWYDTNTHNLRCYVTKTIVSNNLDSSIKHNGWIYLMSMTGSQPTTPYSGQMYYDTTQDVIDYWNNGLQSWDTISSNRWSNNTFVLKTGDTMTGVLHMSSNNISNLLDPTLAQDATTKHYTDTTFVFKTGDTMTGVLHMSSKNISEVADPVVAQDAATKNYVDTTENALLSKINAINSFPKGGIIMWSGSIGTIPTGWNLCDGTNGTPDLTDRFIIGAGVTYGPGGTGGTATPDLSFTTDSHTLTIDEMPAHSHTVTHDAMGWPQGGGAGYYYRQSQIVGATIKIDSAGGGQGHTHTGKVGTSIEILPPYYALAFIMKS